jgi:hypothetical protein
MLQVVHLYQSLMAPQIQEMVDQVQAHMLLLVKELAALVL